MSERLGHLSSLANINCTFVFKSSVAKKHAVKFLLSGTYKHTSISKYNRHNHNFNGEHAEVVIWSSEKWPVTARMIVTCSVNWGENYPVFLLVLCYHDKYSLEHRQRQDEFSECNVNYKPTRAGNVSQKHSGILHLPYIGSVG